MSKNVDFEVGTIVTDVFLDLLQEQLTGNMQNVRLAPSFLGTDRVAIAVSGDVINDKRAALNIQGRYTFTDVSKDSSPSEAGNGTKNLWISTTANGTTQQPDFDFSVGVAPPAASYIRKIGTATRTGSQLSDVKLSNGATADADQYNSFTFRSVMDLSGEQLLTLRGQDGQTSPNAVLVPDPSLTPTKALNTGFDTAGVYTERFYLDTMGRLVWTAGANDLALSWLEADVLGTNTEFASRPDGADATAFSTRREGVDSQNAWRIGNEGHIQWGSGTAALDVGFSRTNPDILAMDAGDQFEMSYVITFLTDSPNILTNKRYVDERDAYVESTSKRFAFFITY